MFRPSSQYPSFFPESDDLSGNEQLREEYSDLECDESSGQVRQSLFNVFKMMRPVVVLDEAHKAYGRLSASAEDEFVRAISSLNPRVVIELSATPSNRISNLLVDINGPDLKQEEMIKLPIEVTSPPLNSRWEETLHHAFDKLEELESTAGELGNNTGRYIRPIALVRVERTGKNQRDGTKIHADDVKDYLMQKLHVGEEKIRLKSAEKDELKREDLLSEYSQVRWIITKDALREGWDCPFAYLLVILDNTQAKTAITQLVGRIMRQPQAQLTHKKPLDQCYVYCHNAVVEKAVANVRKGLESEGLTGLSSEVVGRGEDIDNVAETVLVKRRCAFQGKRIFLPRVLHKCGESWIQLDYQKHILRCINWAEIGPNCPEESEPAMPEVVSKAIDLQEDLVVYDVVHESTPKYMDRTLRVSELNRHLVNLIPNPWQGARILENLFEILRNRGFSDSEMFDRRASLTFWLCKHVEQQIEIQSERIFCEKLRKDEIRFDLEIDSANYEVRPSYEIEVYPNDKQLAKPYGNALQLNLFKPLYDGHFDSDLEKKFAYYLDEQEALRWWHRVAARQQGEYYLQGWKEQRVYPDFVGLVAKGDRRKRILIFDTKGNFLEQSRDSEYKKKLLNILEGAFNAAGTMNVSEGTVFSGLFDLVFEDYLTSNFAEITPRLTKGL